MSQQQKRRALWATCLASVGAFARGLRAAVPGWPPPARLLTSLVANLAQAVWIPRGGYWYQGTIIGTPFAQGFANRRPT